ncbi:MFS transporter [Rugosimonospora acidiphila]|uniref:MFS transporter n=1 Tax=Rugosimonospora acidiphila TaxID=556531 RepID=A0ABP9RKR9_9ACTN
MRLGRPFTLLWAGQSASLIGDQLTRLALPLVAVLVLHATPGQVAALAAAGQLPFLILALPAGVWVARFGLRRAMLAADMVRGVAILSVPLFGAGGYPRLLVVAVVVGVATVPFQLAYQSVVPALVPAELIPAANRRLTLSESAAALLGPAAAGLLVGAVGAVRALYADAASYLVSIATLAAVRDGGAIGHADAGGAVRQVIAGWRYVLASPPLRALMWASALFNAGFAGYEALLTVFAIRTLHLTPGTLGLSVAAGGVGVPLGVALSRTAERRVGRGPTLVLAAALSAAGPFLVAAATPGTAVQLVAAATAVTGIGGGCWGVAALTTRQLLSHPDMRVQTTATHRFVSLGVLAPAAWAAGLAADTVGPRWAILTFAALGALSLLPLLRVPRLSWSTPTVRAAASTPKTTASTYLGLSRSTSGTTKPRP